MALPLLQVDFRLVVGEMDRISQLPECIAHRILSFLNNTLDSSPPSDLVRMSVLSKIWFHLTASFHLFDFSIHKFKNRESFFKYVEYTTSRFCHKDVTGTARKFKLVTTIEEPAELDIVNRCLELVLKKGVNVLDIDIVSAKRMPTHRLPDILLSVSVLKYLTIRGCKLPSSLMLGVVKFKYLIRLELERIRIDDEAIKHLTTSCPLLRVFNIDNCYGFKTFCVCGHQSLRNIYLAYSISVERIDIEAPNLSILMVVVRHGRDAPQMDLLSCKKLTNVTYIGHPSPNWNGFTNFLSNFPFVEKMILATKHERNNLKLSSQSLRILVLHSKFDLEEIELSTPNLGLLIYSSIPQYFWRMVRHLSHLKACMQCYLDDNADILWFQKLRLFLDKKNGFKASNLYIYTIQKFIELEKLKAIELPSYELNHVELHIDNHEESSDHASFVEAVLLCCRPRSLTLRSSFPLTDFEEQSDLVKFTYEKLLQQENQGHTNIQIVSPFSSEAQKHFKGLMPLAKELPLGGKAISFIKEEVAQEEVDIQRYADMKIF